MIGQQTLFSSGQGGCHTCRMPALLAAANGDLPAFCAERRGKHLQFSGGQC